MNETSSGCIFLVLQGAALRLCACQLVGTFVHILFFPVVLITQERKLSKSKCSNCHKSPLCLAGYSLRARGTFLAGNIFCHQNMNTCAFSCLQETEKVQLSEAWFCATFQLQRQDRAKLLPCNSAWHLRKQGL